ncbi:hypothetical protein [Methylobacter sp.]|jgi:hypothetical protein|uniref:hypothetical protein n=1 Tax=Methylobacter sp. TaxID=2051955 RepID=UPI003DA26F9C
MTLSKPIALDLPSTDSEYWLQHALGRLVTNPALLERTLQAGVQTTLAGLPETTTTLLSLMLHRQAHRFQLMAKILDERLLKNVLRFLPLTAASTSQEILRQRWQSFRQAQEGTEWPDHRSCAMAFCHNTLVQPGLIDADDSDAVDVMRYEYTVLRVDDRVRRRPPAIDADVIDEVSMSYPALVTACETVRFNWNISKEVLALRTSLTGYRPKTSDLYPHSDSKTAKASEPGETLLFYASWQDSQVRVLRVDPSMLLLVSYCDGLTPIVNLPRQLRQAGYSPQELESLGTTLQKLQRIGLLRLFADPAVARTAFLSQGLR